MKYEPTPKYSKAAPKQSDVSKQSGLSTQLESLISQPIMSVEPMYVKMSHFSFIHNAHKDRSE